MTRKRGSIFSGRTAFSRMTTPNAAIHVSMKAAAVPGSDLGREHFRDRIAEPQIGMTDDARSDTWSRTRQKRSWRCCGRCRCRRAIGQGENGSPSRSATSGAIPIAVGPSFPSLSFLPGRLIRAFVNPLAGGMIEVSTARNLLRLAPAVCAIPGLLSDWRAGCKPQYDSGISVKTSGGASIWVKMKGRM